MVTEISAKIEKMSFWTTTWEVFFMKSTKPDAIARSVAMLLWNQEAPRWILVSRTSFHENLVIKLFLRPFILFFWCTKSSCHLMVNGCALSTGYLPRGGLHRNSVDKLTDRPDMTSAVGRGRIASTQINKQIMKSTAYYWV